MCQESKVCGNHLIFIIICRNKNGKIKDVENQVEIEIKWYKIKQFGSAITQTWISMKMCGAWPCMIFKRNVYRKLLQVPTDLLSAHVHSGFTYNKTFCLIFTEANKRRRLAIFVLRLNNCVLKLDNYGSYLWWWWWLGQSDGHHWNRGWKIVYIAIFVRHT